MSVVLKMIESPDVALIFLIGLLAFIGRQVTAGKPDLKIFSNRCGGAAFLMYAVYGIGKFQPSNAVGFLNVAFSGVFAAGVAACVGRIVAGGVVFIIVNLIGEFRRAMLLRAERAARQRYLRELREPRPVPVEATTTAPVVVEKPKAERIAEAEQEHKELLALIDSMSCDDDEKRSRRIDADDRRFRKMARILK